MNKLYKYLPFDIQGIYTWEQCDDDGCRECSCVVDLLGIDTYNEELKVLDCGTVVDICYTQFKPILRPFEDLTKELPLTKAAAEMIGMKEGDLVIPLFGFYIIHGDFKTDEWFFKNLQVAKDIRENFLIAVGAQTEEEDEEFIAINKDYFLTSYSKTYCNPEQAFDFLRAMHFAVDFTKDEHIKLED